MLASSCFSRIVSVNLQQNGGSSAACADPESFVRGGPFLLVYEGREAPNTTIREPLSAH